MLNCGGGDTTDGPRWEGGGHQIQRQGGLRRAGDGDDDEGEEDDGDWEWVGARGQNPPHRLSMTGFQ